MMHDYSRRLGVLFVALLLLGVGRCGSDPHVEGAKLDLRNKDYARALENVARALEKDPNSSEVHALKGEIMQALVLTAESAEEREDLVLEMASAYRRSVALDSLRKRDVERRLQDAFLQEFVEGMKVYEEAQRMEGEEEVRNAYVVAAKHFFNASVIMPDSFDAYVNEASAYYSGGFFSEAVGAYESALRAGYTEREVFIYLARTWDLMAQSLPDSVGMQYYRRAIQVLEQGMKHHAEDSELRDLLLNYYPLAKQPQEAIAFFESVRGMREGDAVFQYNYGTLLLQTDDYDGAIERLQAAVQLNPSYTNAHLNLGAALINQAVDMPRTQQMHMVSDTSMSNGPDAHQESLFGKAIIHLETARSLAEEASEPTQNICRALWRAYGHTNQRSKADAIAGCAAFDDS